MCIIGLIILEIYLFGTVELSEHYYIFASSSTLPDNLNIFKKNMSYIQIKTKVVVYA